MLRMLNWCIFHEHFSSAAICFHQCHKYRKSVINKDLIHLKHVCVKIQSKTGTVLFHTVSVARDEYAEHLVLAILPHSKRLEPYSRNNSPALSQLYAFPYTRASKLNKTTNSCIAREWAQFTIGIGVSTCSFQTVYQLSCAASGPPLELSF